VAKIQNSRKAKITAERHRRDGMSSPTRLVDWNTGAPATSTPPGSSIYQDQLIRMPQVREICPLSRPSLYRLIREGKFPPPISLGGGRAVAWLRREVDDFVRQRIAERAGERNEHVGTHTGSPP
jgi:prophage regulatory protein